MQFSMRTFAPFRTSTAEPRPALFAFSRKTQLRSSASAPSASAPPPPGAPAMPFCTKKPSTAL
jgi:hypothetical protein